MLELPAVLHKPTFARRGKAMPLKESMCLCTCCRTEEHDLGTVALATHRFDVLHQSAADAHAAPRLRDDHVLDDTERLAAIHGVEAYGKEERAADDAIHFTDKQIGVRVGRYRLQAFCANINMCILHEGPIQRCNHCGIRRLCLPDDHTGCLWALAYLRLAHVCLAL